MGPGGYSVDSLLFGRRLIRSNKPTKAESESGGFPNRWAGNSVQWDELGQRLCHAKRAEVATNPTVVSCLVAEEEGLDPSLVSGR